VRRSKIVIEFSPSRLDAALVIGGRVVASHLIALDPARWEASWTAGLKTLDAPLRQALDALRAPRGATVTLVYHSPDATSEIVSSPTAAAQAVEAARLALSDAVAFSLDRNPHTAHLMTSDTSGDPVRRHVLATADSETCTSTLVAWVERAGRRLVGLVPAEAAMQARLLRGILRSSTNTVHAVLHLGEHRSALAVGERGTLHFLRRIDTDLGALADALTRPFTPRGGDSEVTLSRDEAMRLLVSTGVPKPGAVIDEARAIRGADVLPLIQPLLQRCVVDTKQSLRFGLSDEARARTVFSVHGPGAAAPGLADVLASQIECTLEAPTEGGYAPEASCNASGDLCAWLDCADLDLNLLPRPAVMRASARAASHGLWIGGAAAAVLLGAEALLITSATDAVTARREQIGAVAEAVREADSVRRNAESLATQVDTSKQLIAEQMGRRVDWAAFLAELSSVTPDAIRLTGVTGGSGSTGAPSATLRGYLRVSDGADARAPVAAYVDRLAACPLVSRVAIGGTQRAEVEGMPAQRFDLSLEFVGVPVTLDDGPEAP